MGKTINRVIKEDLRAKEQYDARHAMTNLMVTVFGGEQMAEGTSGAKMKFEGMVDKVKQLIEFHNKLDQRLSQLENTLLAVARAGGIKPEDVATEIFNETGAQWWETNFKFAVDPLIAKRLKENETPAEHKRKNRSPQKAAL